MRQRLFAKTTQTPPESPPPSPAARITPCESHQAKWQIAIPSTRSKTNVWKSLIKIACARPLFTVDCEFMRLQFFVKQRHKLSQRSGRDQAPESSVFPLASTSAPLPTPLCFFSFSYYTSSTLADQKSLHALELKTTRRESRCR